MTRMNRYARLAHQMWAQHAPQALEQLSEPTAYFEAVGVNAAAQIEAMSSQMSRSLPADLPYLEKVGRLRAIRQQAEETVLKDLIYDPVAQASSAETGPDPLLELEVLLGEAPSPQNVREQLRMIQDDAEDQAEAEGWEDVTFSPQQQEQMDWLLQMLPLVNLEVSQMSTSAAQETIARLKALLASRP